MLTQNEARNSSGISPISLEWEAEGGPSDVCLPAVDAPPRGRSAAGSDPLPLPGDAPPGGAGEAPGNPGDFPVRLACGLGGRRRDSARDAAQPGRPLGSPAALS